MAATVVFHFYSVPALSLSCSIRCRNTIWNSYNGIQESCVQTVLCKRADLQGRDRIQLSMQLMSSDACSRPCPCSPHSSLYRR
jgi:hypothetical protein